MSASPKVRTNSGSTKSQFRVQISFILTLSTGHSKTPRAVPTQFTCWRGCYLISRRYCARRASHYVNCPMGFIRPKDKIHLDLSCLLFSQQCSSVWGRRYKFGKPGSKNNPAKSARLFDPSENSKIVLIGLLKSWNKVDREPLALVQLAHPIRKWCVWSSSCKANTSNSSWQYMGACPSTQFISFPKISNCKV